MRRKLLFRIQLGRFLADTTSQGPDVTMAFVVYRCHVIPIGIDRYVLDRGLGFRNLIFFKWKRKTQSNFNEHIFRNF